MKKVILFSLSFLILSCETPKKKEKVDIVKKETTKKPILKKKTPKVKNIDNTLITLQRKPCSGDCPVFKVHISKDGLLTYNGIEYTNITGKRTLKLSSKQQTKLSSIINASNFSTLKSEYTDRGTEDFAETIMTYQNKSVMVRLWKDAPENLTDIYVFIEDILYDKKYLE